MPAPSAKPLSAPPFGDPSETKYALGRRVVAWIQRNCVYGEGDKFGQPVKLEAFQARFLLQLFETRPDGSRRYRRALFESPKGNGKTPLASWVAAYELATRESAVIPVGAASFEQAGLLFGDLLACVRESPSLYSVLEPFEAEIQVRTGPGRAYKVAAIAGTNDGQRPTLFVADEIHEWLGNRARTHLVIANGCSKRQGSLQLNLTTPGTDPETLAGQLHDYGLRVNSGEIDDPGFLFVWYGCPADAFDLEDRDELRTAIRAANPAADKFLNVEDVAARYSQVPRHEFLRYHLGQWVSLGEAWLAPGSWAACAAPGRVIPAGADVVLGVDSSFTSDSTAVVAVDLGEIPHIAVVGVWERPDNAPADWQIPVLDVEQAIRDARSRWNVREVACDEYRFQRSMAILEAEGAPIVKFPQVPQRLAPATARFYEAVINRHLTHDNDARLARHLSNCVLKTDSRGQRVTKESRTSTRHIDAAIAALMALDRACQQPARKPRTRFINLATVDLDDDPDALL